MFKFKKAQAQTEKAYAVTYATPCGAHITETVKALTQAEAIRKVENQPLDVAEISTLGCVEIIEVKEV